MVKTMKDFPTNNADLKFYKTMHEHIGEAQPIGANNTCEHPFLVPSPDKTLCILPGRIDVARHYMRTGGVEGAKKSYNKLLSSVQSFGRYMFNVSEYDLVKNLFASDDFQSAAKSVCPADKQMLDPFQFNFIIQIPGQTVAMHLDAPYFWGASRFQFPQWLLATMKFSNLFQDRYVDQVQVVGYLHKWNDSKRDGNFVYWNTEDQKMQSIPPTPRYGVSVDGAKVLHAAAAYQPDTEMPFLDKSKDNLLQYQGEDKWILTSDGKTLSEYTTDDLRVTIVYRARCFATEEEIVKFRDMATGNGELLTLESILDTFKEDLIKRGRLTRGQEISSLDFAFMLMDEYTTYPLPPNAIIPVNYCMLGKLFPQTDVVFSKIC
eukprot:TRINITY_DN1621_c0_g1_i2.p1 TRINITY_DN1621_c0_g1~~TRINITY_DN1621_c0_g1_i2.p1  ORF type:complete len:376 (+),score=59.96 TRINITY_DN1621_c0_g1_i2:536-1663(+)